MEDILNSLGDVGSAVLIMGGLGLLFGVILAVAYRLLRVEEDPRIDDVEQMLPGSNCGACGSPGCRAFAELVVAGDVAPSACTVSSPDGIGEIAGYLGVDAGDAVKRVARLKCAGGRGRAKQIAAYEGFESCRGAALVSVGGKGCSWGCLGLGDCDVACGFDAIHMSEIGLPVVNVDLCTACGDCVTACPQDLFEILPLNQNLFVQCRIPLAGDAARSLCSVTCDACGRCAADAPEGLVVMEGNLPEIDYAAGGPATPAVVARCPTGAIQWLMGPQFPEFQDGAGAAPATSREPVLASRRLDVLSD